MKNQSVLFLLIVVVLAFPQSTTAEPKNSQATSEHAKPKRVRADDKAIAADAIGSFVNQRQSPSARQARKDAVHAMVAERARQKPQQITSATLVFRTGLTVSELVELTESHDLEIMAIDVKTPYNDIGVIQTIHIGAIELLKWDGDIEAKAKKAIGSYRYKYMQRAEKLESLYGQVTEDSEAYRNMAWSEMLIYRSEVFGDARSIKDAVVHSKIALVVPDAPDTAVGKVDSYKSRKIQTEERRTARRNRSEKTG